MCIRDSDWVVGDGAAAPARRAVVDSSLCLDCHVGSMYQHGGNRVDNVDMCYLCHNPAAKDEYVRVDTFGVDASESYYGRAGQSFGMKEMLQAVHPAGATGNPVVIYRGLGIYGWADDVSKLNNWPLVDDCVRSNGSPGRLVVGADDPTAPSACQPHIFHVPTYPRALNDCAACHVADVALFPDGAKAMATTVEAGAPRFGDQVNDVLEGVQTSSCVTCHGDTASKAHAYQNGWAPQEFEEGRKTIIDAHYNRYEGRACGPASPNRERVKTRGGALPPLFCTWMYLCRGGHGASRSIVQLPSSSLVYSKRSCRRLRRPCQNSTWSGTIR